MSSVSMERKVSNEKAKRPSLDRADRTSFSSIKETRSGVAQSFSDSKTSSYQRIHTNCEDAIDDASSGTATPLTTDLERSVKLPCAGCGVVCPCDGFLGWKGVNVRGKIASKSFGDLRSLNRERLQWDVTPTEKEAHQSTLTRKLPDGNFPPGRSPLERLPMELLRAIIDRLATDIPPNGFTARNIDLMSLLLTSHSIHAATLSTLYNQITIPHSRIFRKFLTHISQYPSLGTIVRRIDFSHFNPTGAGQTARERAQTLNLIPATLLKCLTLTPNLREFLAQEHIDDDLSFDVLRMLFTNMPHLQALDFCACSSPSFRDALSSVVQSKLPDTLPITRLSMHECTILPAAIFDSLLPRLPRLTHLDVAHTRITDSALHSIPSSARLTHLNLSKCSSLSGSAVVSFITTHPAAQQLIYLNLAMDAKSHEMLSAEEISALLPKLPQTLRSLNLKGSKMHAGHMRLLLPLTKHLEELGLGRHLSLHDLSALFVPDENASLEEQVAWVPHSLRYVDISDMTAADLDLVGLLNASCPIMKGISRPLEVLELSTEGFAKLGKSAGVKRAGWCLKDAGRRGWAVREKRGADGETDNGMRDWKLGASYWGMRKVPVARAEVGGMYGHYMFKR